MARINILYYSILFIPYYLALNHITFSQILYLTWLSFTDLFSYKTISTNPLGVYKRHLDVSKSYRKGHENHFPNRVRLHLFSKYNKFEISTRFLHEHFSSMNLFYSEIGITPIESSKPKLWHFNANLVCLPSLH